LSFDLIILFRIVKDTDMMNSTISNNINPYKKNFNAKNNPEFKGMNLLSSKWMPKIRKSVIMEKN